MNLYHLHFPGDEDACDLLLVAPSPSEALSLGRAWDGERREPTVTPMLKEGASVILGEIVIVESDEGDGDEVRIEPVDGGEDDVLTADMLAELYDRANGEAEEEEGDEDDDDELDAVQAICGDTINDGGIMRVCAREEEHAPPHRGKDAATGEVVEWE